jgi:hypothetical protein
MSITSNNIGKYLVHVVAYGKETLEQSKVIDTSSQTCPDDIDSLCYTDAGTFSFASKSVPIDSRIQVCVEEISSGIQNCVGGKNREEDTPELITVGVPRQN